MTRKEIRTAIRHDKHPTKELELMLTDMAVEAAIGIGAAQAIGSLALVAMCHWDQRHGRDTGLELRYLGRCIRFNSECGAEKLSARTAHEGETDGEHHIPSTPDAAPASRDKRHLSVVGDPK